MQNRKQLLTLLTVWGISGITVNLMTNCHTNLNNPNIQWSNTSTFPINLKALKQIDSPIAIGAIDQTHVTRAEILAALAPHVLAAIQSIAPTATASDYIVMIYTIDALGNYNEIVGTTNLQNQGTIIYVQITAVEQDLALTGNSDYLAVPIPIATADISSLTSISDGAYILNGVISTSSVTVDEIRNGLLLPILTAIQTIDAMATDGDFTYTVSTRNAQGVYIPVTNPIDLQHKEVIFYVQITAKDNSKVISGQTGQIQIRLNAVQKIDVSTLTINDINTTVTGNSLSQIDAINIQTDIKTKVQAAFNAIIKGVTLYADYQILNLNAIKAGIDIPNQGLQIIVTISPISDSPLLVPNKTKDIKITITPDRLKLINDPK